jgi:hypothetical protein
MVPHEHSPFLKRSLVDAEFDMSSLQQSRYRETALRE